MTAWEPGAFSSGTGPEDREVIRRHARRGDGLGVPRPRQVQAGILGAGHPVEDVVLLLPVEKIGDGHGKRLLTRKRVRRRHVPDEDESVGIAEGQRLQQDPVDDAEDRRVRADPERQNDDGGERERGALGEQSQPMPKVSNQAAHGARSSRGPNGKSAATAVTGIRSFSERGFRRSVRARELTACP